MILWEVHALADHRASSDMLESQDRVQLEVEEVVVVIGMNPTDVLLMMILMIGMFHSGQTVSVLYVTKSLCFAVYKEL